MLETIWFRTLLIGLLAAHPILNAQSFKGHRIGETISDFLKTEPKLQQQLSDCQSTKPHELTPEEIKARYGKKQLEQLQKRQAANTNAEYRVAIMSEDPDIYGDRCGAILAALGSGNGYIDGNGYDIGNKYSLNLLKRLQSEPNLSRPTHVSSSTNFIFRDSKLESLTTSLNATYEQLRTELTQRIGVNPTERLVPFHNALGATWNEVVAIWDTKDLHAELHQNNNPAEPSIPFFSVRTEESYRRAQTQGVQDGAKQAERALD